MNIELKHGCSLQALKAMADNQFDWAIVDPEYGRKEHGGVNRSGWVTQANGTKMFVKNGNHYAKKQWDNAPAGKDYFTELFRVSKNQIIWGCNYYSSNFGSGRIIWDKCNEGSDQSDCEIAYNSSTDRVDLFRFMWRGMMQGKSIREGHIMQGNKKLNEKRIHPTQKPVALYKWLLDKYTSEGDLILDTHLGSGSIAIACHDLKRKLIAYEIDKEYYEAACKRFETHTAQLQLQW